ncbi:serine hydrolase domain-containing protein [Actinomycetospora sp. OC33-EN08]|uniref:Serine hydrolase domain-containing protein n=1 Tax=Actinomycetospora aurantiaca TaxID=3129233 RepID=A0ABU8MUW5_9PSEU
MSARLAVALASIALSVTACGTPATPAAGARPPGPPPAYAAALEPQITDLMRQLQIPGALVHVDVPGQGTWQAALGSATVPAGRPMQLDDHMRIGSVTKTITADVVLQLAGQGRLALEDPVSKFLPATPNGGAMTVRQLLDMTAGVFNFTEDDYFNRALDATPQRAWTAAETIDIAMAHPPYFPPGTGFHYSNSNYEMLGVIAEQVGGKPLPQLFAELVAGPLGMSRTSLPAWDDPAIPQPHPQGYMFGNNEIGNAAYNAAIAGDKANAQIAVAPGTRPNDVTLLPVNGQASGGAISTLGDMAIWARALGTGQLLTPGLQAERTRYGAESGYGLGLQRTPTGLVGHDGAVPGFQSSVYYEPTTGATIVVLTNLLLAPNTYFVEALPAERIVALVALAVIRP